jgi:hypothetical protein
MDVPEVTKGKKVFLGKSSGKRSMYGVSTWKGTDIGVIDKLLFWAQNSKLHKGKGTSKESREYCSGNQGSNKNFKKEMVNRVK